MGRTKNAKDYLIALQRLKKDCNQLGKSPNRNIEEWEQLLDINERVSCILGIANSNRKSTNMLFFVMYDIESNKVRNYVVKYLERKGCTRVQKSIFLANLSTKSGTM